MNWHEKLDRWNELKATIKALSDEEKVLREELFEGSFPAPKEGVNKVDIGDGRTLKGTYRLYRRPIPEKIADLPERLQSVFKQSFSLLTGEYRKLSAEDRNTVDTALNIKPGLPGLELTSAK